MTASDPPKVTVAMASYNSGDHIEAALESVLSQSLTALEVIVVDDRSSDDSVAKVAAIAARDPRVRLEIMPQNGGPAAVRNRVIELARGDWYAVVDSDDLIHADRLARLIARADADGADMIADDLMVFYSDAAEPAERFLKGARAKSPSWVSLEGYLAETRIFSGKPNLGYLKPMIRLNRLRASGVRYDEALRIAEDDDLVVRLLAAGLRYRLDPLPSYLYRKHGGSISHRLPADAMDRIAEAQERLSGVVAKVGPAASAGMAARRRAATRAQVYVAMVDGLKARAFGKVAAAAARDPLALIHFQMVAQGRLNRWLSKLGTRGAQVKIADRKPSVCIISRQRLVGATNGSSTYLLDLVASIREAGFEPHLIQPSPVVFGRWPVLKFKPEMGAFATIRLRGAARIGPYAVVLDPKVYLNAARGVIAQILGKLRLPNAWLGAAAAPYAIAAPWEAQDFAFVARHAPAVSDRIITDYVFQSQAIPYALRPDAPTAVIMHDLFHARAQQFAKAGGADSVALLDAASEWRMMRQTDAVIAIQAAEGAEVAAALTDRQVVVAPMAANCVAEPQPGDDDSILFVASNAAPNVIGLTWLFGAVWPAVMAARPSARLTVVGNVSRAFPAGGPAGVTFTGPVPDLDAYYPQAGVVISPLTTGSGLKIKLIEALAQGKALVATSVTLQGVEAQTAGAVALTDDPHMFAAQIVRLTSDKAARQALASAGLDAARRHFSREACHRDFRAWLTAAGPRVT